MSEEEKKEENPVAELNRKLAEAKEKQRNSITKYGRPKNKIRTALGNGNAAEIFTHDEYGLALDSLFWAKKNCDQCNGKGQIWKARVETKPGPKTKLGKSTAAKTIYETKKIGEGKHQRTVEVPKVHDEMHPCACAVTRYRKEREKVEQRLYIARGRGGKDAETAELELFHKENGHLINLTQEPILMTNSDEDAGVPDVPQRENTST